jgi:two-component system, cell cycle sensor histidine kinase and response regulator CckA
MRRPDGTIRWLHHRGFPVRDDEGQVYRFAGFTEDVTRRRVLEEQLRQAQKLEAVGRLAGGVAHDFNNILTIIKGHSYLLLESVPPLDPIRPDIEEIDRSADRAASLTRQLLAFSRKQVLKPQIVDANQSILALDRMLHRLIGEDIELVTRCDASIDRVEVDPGQLEQVITNLVINARDAMPTGGTLVVSSGSQDLDRDLWRDGYVIPAGRYVSISVADTGIGMTDEVKRQVFDPFYTTKPPGREPGWASAPSTGSSSRAAASSRSRARRTAAPRSRCCCRPAAGRGRKRAARGTRPRRARRRSATVLVAEDDPSVRSLVTQVLRTAGYRVFSTASPADALAVGAEHGEAIDVLLTDVVMPEMGGAQLAEYLKRQHPKLKVVFISGYTEDAIAQRGTLLPGAPLLEKPFTPTRLLQLLREVLA